MATVTSTQQARTAWAVTFLTVVLLTLSRALLPGQEWRLTSDFISGAFGNALIILACAGVGLLIISRRPGNVIGWIYALVALVFAAGELAGTYTSRPLPAREWVALLPDLAWSASIPLGATLLLLLCPTGRPPSPRWRPVVWAVVVGHHAGFGRLGPDARPDGLPARGRQSSGGWSGPDGCSTFSSKPRS